MKHKSQTSFLCELVAHVGIVVTPFCGGNVGWDTCFLTRDFQLQVIFMNQFPLIVGTMGSNVNDTKTEAETFRYRS